MQIYPASTHTVNVLIIAADVYNTTIDIVEGKLCKIIRMHSISEKINIGSIIGLVIMTGVFFCPKIF